MNKRYNKILIKTVPIDKNLLKIGVREPKVANIDDTLIYTVYQKYPLLFWRWHISTK